MENKLLKRLIILFFGFLPILCFSQNYDKSLLEQITPTDPTSASLGKYGVYPVNYSNGLVPITIPLYQIKSGDLTQTIELSYHGGGIRVSEEATWVGLGWDLNFGGVITRTMNGFPDELETSAVPDANALFNAMNNNSNLSNLTLYENYSSALSPNYSFKPDLYQYNFGNYSGTFIALGNLPISIAHSAITGTVSSNGIQLIDPIGTIYNFNGIETTTLTGSMVKNAPYFSGYYINSITSANKTDTIAYEYQIDGNYRCNLNSVMQGFKSTTVTCAGGNSDCGCIGSIKKEFIPETTTTMFQQTVHSSKPHYIYFNEGRITFNLSSRNDVDPAYSDNIKKLESIIVEKKVGSVYVPQKIFRFNYTYFNPTSTDFNNLRLRLESVEEESYLTGDSRLIGCFDYYGNNFLPNKKSFSFDYWGFYNGKNNSTPIPLSYDSYYTYGGADKTPDPVFAQYGTLKNISYPTKGKTEFIWEGNQINSDKPVYNPAETISVDLATDDNATFVCYPISPSDGAYSYSFRSNISQTVVVNYRLYQKDGTDVTHRRYDTGSVKVNDQVLSAYIKGGNITYTKTFYLSPGQDFNAELAVNCSNVKGEVWFSFNSYNPSTNLSNYPFAGIRIKNINNYNNNGDSLTSKSYTYLDPLGHSSGFLTNNQSLSYDKYSTSVSGGIETFTCPNTTKVTKHLFFSTLKTGLDASNFGYEYVQEYNISNGKDNGYTSYQFTKGTDNFYNNDIPLVSKSHTRGQLINKTDYNRTINSYQKVKESLNYYNHDTRITAKKMGFAMSQYLDYTSSTSLSNYVYFSSNQYYQSNIFQPTNYVYTSDWMRLDSTVTKEYFQLTDPVITKTDYVYNNIKHLQPTIINSCLNNGDIKRVVTVYPSDDPSAIAVEMDLKNILLLQLDIKEYVLKNGSAQKLVDGNKLTYTKDINNHILLTKVSKYLPDGTTNDEFDYSYNSRSRLTEILGKDGVKTAICWDANNYNPIVVGKNISYNVLSAALQSGNNDPKALFSNSNCSQALLSTFTYLPLVGIESKTDPRGVTVYYSYDGLGRLTEVYRMQNGVKQTIQSYQYNFKH